MRKVSIIVILLMLLCVCTGNGIIGTKEETGPGEQVKTGVPSGGAIAEKNEDHGPVEDENKDGSENRAPEKEEPKGGQQARKAGGSEAGANNHYFGFADETGTKIIVPSGSLTEEIKDPRAIGLAIGDNGSAVEIGYIKKQDAGSADNGRFTMQNFKNLEGYIFGVEAGKVVPNNSYYLVQEPGFDRASLIKSSRPAENRVDAATIGRIEKEKQRKVKNAWILAAFEAERQVCLVEFEKDQKNLLASIVLVQPETISFKDYPAEFNGTSAWRVDDGGEIRPEMFNILFVARSDQKTWIGVTWAGAEGEVAFILQDAGSQLEEMGERAGRYWSPA